MLSKEEGRCFVRFSKCKTEQNSFMFRTSSFTLGSLKKKGAYIDTYIDISRGTGIRYSAQALERDHSVKEHQTQ